MPQIFVEFYGCDGQVIAVAQSFTRPVNGPGARYFLLEVQDRPFVVFLSMN